MPHGRKLRRKGMQSAQATQLSDQVGLAPKAREGRLPHHSARRCMDGIRLLTAVASALQQPEDTSSHVQFNRPDNSAQGCHRQSPRTKLGGPSPL